MRLAIYAGTFDPFTNGHLDIVLRGRRIFDRVCVAVLDNREKRPLFTVDERVAMIRESLAVGDGVEVEAFTGLAVDFARSRGAVALLRGLRTQADFDPEQSMALMNQEMEPSVESVFLLADRDHVHVSSSRIRELAGFGRDVAGHVPPPVVERLKEKFR